MSKTPDRQQGNQNPRLAQVKREVLFFRAITKLNDGKLVPFLYEKTVDCIRAKPKNNRYMWFDKNRMLCEPQPVVRDQLLFYLTKMGNLPEIEDLGGVSPLDLSETAGLAKRTHIRFFPDNVVGVMRSSGSPLAQQVSRYLETQCASEKIPFHGIFPLVDCDRKALIRRADHFKRLELKLDLTLLGQPTLVEEQKGPFATALEGFARNLRSQSVRLVLETPDAPGVKEFLLEMCGINTVSKSLLSLNAKAADDEDNAYQISFFDNQVKTEVKVLKESERGDAVQSFDAFAKISDAYEKVKNKLKEAVCLELEPKKG